MEPKFKPVRPDTLVEGNEYLVNERGETTTEGTLVSVKFIAYCASPAFVIVSNCKGKMRCARDDVFQFLS